MSPDSTLPRGTAERMIEIPAGEIVLRDEGTQKNWKVEVAPFRPAPYPVTRELYRAVRGAPEAGGWPRDQLCWPAMDSCARFVRVGLSVGE
jgi:formylglycine-generating enzyme